MDEKVVPDARKCLHLGEIGCINPFEPGGSGELACLTTRYNSNDFLKFERD